MGDMRRGGGGERGRGISVIPHPDSIRPELLHVAESHSSRIVQLVQPTVASERKRTEVVNYVQNLIGSSLGSQVVAFGSVPLKTFLPDGDIDLTALGDAGGGGGGDFAQDVLRMLESEEGSLDAELDVRDVKFISADVQLVKCLIQNIIVDISFNQSGGLCTLCFLELVDERIGKDHLFKRSVILVKSWCYYESRILGAHHGLFSTYALETLVLYIFNLFHKSLDGPLAVLYRFLEYFSNFDWDRYCITLYGPVKLSSLPNLDVEMVNQDSNDLLLTRDHVKEIVESFCLPPMESDTKSKKLFLKHLNIIDPLKETNNLGRSVGKSSYYRIKSAFSYGARKLGQMLTSSPDSIPDEISLFFTNTIQRNKIAKQSDPSSNPSQNEPPFPVSDLAGDLDCHMAALRQVRLHLEEDHFVGFSASAQNGSGSSGSGLNGSGSNPSSSSTPVSSSGSTGEDQVVKPSSVQENNGAPQNPNNNNNSVWDPMCQHQQQNYYFAPAQFFANQCYVTYVAAPMEELQYQAQEYEQLVPYQPVQTGTGIYTVGTGLNGSVPVSPRVGNSEDPNKHHGTGTYLPSSNYNAVQRDNRRPYGNFRKNATPYHPARSRNNNSNNNNTYNNNNNNNHNSNSSNNNTTTTNNNSNNINNNNNHHNYNNSNYNNTYNNNNSNNYNNNNNSNNYNNNYNNNNRNRDNYNRGKNVNPNNLRSAYVRKDNNNNNNCGPKVPTEKNPKPLTGPGPGPEPNGPGSTSNTSNKNLPKIEFGSLGPVLLQDKLPEICKTYESIGSSDKKDEKEVGCDVKAKLKEKVLEPVREAGPVRDEAKSGSWAQAASKRGPYQLKNEGDFPPL